VVLEGLLGGVTSTAAFGTLVGDVGLDVLTGAASGTEVLDGFPTVAATAHEEGVLTGGGDGGKLVEGDAFSADGFDALAGFAGEAEGADADGGELVEADVIEDVTNNDGDGGLSLGVLPDGLTAHDDGEAGEGDGAAVATALEEALVDSLVEGGLGAAGQELVKLQEELDVGIGGVGVATNEVLRLFESFNINTHVWSSFVLSLLFLVVFLLGCFLFSKNKQ